jgi:hypothetical protein
MPGIVPFDRLTHLHVTTDARDCDGRYEQDYVWVPNDDETFRDMWSWHVARAAARDYDHNATFERGVTLDGLPFADYAATTEEGYSSEYVTGCDGCCDPRATRYRDHTAELAGY